MSLDEIGEFGIIQRIRKRVQSYSKSTILGIGDDSAVLRTGKGRVLLLTTDMFIEGIHFDPSLYSEKTYYYIGYRAIASSVSDIAAMGGIPLHSVVSIALPIEMSLSDVDDLIDGIEDVCKNFKIDLTGGDTVRSPGGIAINICITGEIEDSLCIKRSGARVSDIIFVTGTLGDSAMGLEILKKSSEFRVQSSEFLIKRHLMPQPRIKEGRTIALNRLATSMIDISDGLSSDLWHICEESGVGAEIYSSSIPLSKELKEVAEKSGLNPMLYALNEGEDYELLFTTPEGLAGEVIKRLPATVIGKILPEDAGVTIVDNEGRGEKLIAGGYNHFKN